MNIPCKMIELAGDGYINKFGGTYRPPYELVKDQLMSPR
jgi:hypothetical protein